MQPWITIRHLIRLWLLSICHSELGPGTQYVRRLISCFQRLLHRSGSTLCMPSRSLCRGTQTPCACNMLRSKTCPQLGWRNWSWPTSWSKLASEMSLYLSIVIPTSCSFLHIVVRLTSKGLSYFTPGITSVACIFLSMCNITAASEKMCVTPTPTHPHPHTYTTLASPITPRKVMLKASVWCFQGQQRLT